MPQGSSRRDQEASTSPTFHSLTAPASASHPSFVILILSNEVDIAGPMGHWGAAPAAAAYAQLLASVTEQLLAFDSTRAYLGDAGFGEGLGGEIFDDHTYYGWYQGDPEVRKLEHPRTRAYIANPVPL